MVEITLTYHLVYQWHRQAGTSVIGKAWMHNRIWEETSLASLFKDVRNETDFLQLIRQLDGHFSVITETPELFLMAVDRLRTFPLFMHQGGSDITVTDQIVFNQETADEAATAIFKKIYCTPENTTLLNGWQQLQAGEYIVIDKKSNKYTIQTYYKHQASIQSATSDVLMHQLSALEEQLAEKTIRYANGRTILLPLSGGYDSRYLLAILKRKGYHAIECFTYGKKDSFEVLIARNVCETLQVKWHFIEYTDALLQHFFTEQWQLYSNLNHHYTSLPHEQEFFALAYLQEQHLLPDNAIVMNGFCQDIHAGSYLEPVRNFDVGKYIQYKFGIRPLLSDYENSWNGYREWLIKNRLSKFIVNSVRVYEFFGLDFYLPFWQTDWIHFWYSLPLEQLQDQYLFRAYLFQGIFKTYKIDFKKPEHTFTGKLYNLRRIGKTILPASLTKAIQAQQSKNPSRDINNTLFLYEELYKRLENPPAEKDFKINNIHALYLLQNLKENKQL